MQRLVALVMLIASIYCNDPVYTDACGAADIQPSAEHWVESAETWMDGGYMDEALWDYFDYFFSGTPGVAD